MSLFKTLLVIPACACAALFSGCVGVGPNTQQGSVTGGALGALAGAIIGHNSGGHALGGALIGATAGAVAGGTIGNSVDNERGTLYGSESVSSSPGFRSRHYTAVSQIPPQPAPLPDPVSAPPSPNALWIPGYWSYSENRYTWIAGHWEIPPPNVQNYVVAHWENRGSGYVFVPSYWR